MSRCWVAREVSQYNQSSDILSSCLCAVFPFSLLLPAATGKNILGKVFWAARIRRSDDVALRQVLKQHGKNKEALQVEWYSHPTPPPSSVRTRERNALHLHGAKIGDRTSAYRCLERDISAWLFQAIRTGTPLRCPGGREGVQYALRYKKAALLRQITP